MSSKIFPQTKIESAANRYTFVWKKAVTKNQIKLPAKITDLIAECEEMYSLKLVYKDSISLHSLKRIRKKLYVIKEDAGYESEENYLFIEENGQTAFSVPAGLLV